MKGNRCEMTIGHRTNEKSSSLMMELQIVDSLAWYSRRRVPLPKYNALKSRYVQSYDSKNAVPISAPAVDELDFNLLKQVRRRNWSGKVRYWRPVSDRRSSCGSSHDRQLRAERSSRFGAPADALQAAQSSMCSFLPKQIFCCSDQLHLTPNSSMRLAISQSLTTSLSNGPGLSTCASGLSTYAF